MKELLPFWPQIFIILYLSLRQFKDWFLDGTERKIEFSPIKRGIIQVLYLWIIVQGGFFNYWGFAQWIYLILQILTFVIVIFDISNPDKINKNKTKVVESNIIGTLLVFGLFYWGGFFDSFFAFLMK